MFDFSERFIGVRVIWAKHPWLSAFIFLFWFVRLFSASYINHVWPFFFLKSPQMMTNIWTSHVPEQINSHTKVSYLNDGRGRGFWCSMWHETAYVSICSAEGIYSLSYLKEQIISGSAPLPRGTCSSFTEIILSAVRGRRVGRGWERGWRMCASCKIPFECI